jgi:integrase
MARIVGRLKSRQVTNAKPKRGKQWAVIPDGGNLYLQATRGKDGHISRSWLFKYELAGKRHELGLGGLHTLSLAEARDKARGFRQQLLDGVDPLAERRKQRQALIAEQAKAVTFKQRAEQFMALHEKGWSAEHASQWRGSLKAYVYSKIGGLAPAAIDSAMVLNVVQPHWQSKTVTMQRVLHRIEQVLDYCATCGDRTGDNPARNVARALPKPATITKVERHPALPYADMPALMADLRKVDTVGSKALQFLIMTASRASEILQATWSEIDFAERKWTRPAEHMKGREDHVVPLTKPMLEILRQMQDYRAGPGENRIFPRGEHDMRRVLRKFKSPSECDVHGMRSTFRQWATERTNFADHIAEIALAHKVGGDIERVYKRAAEMFDRRRKLMDAWATFCTKPPARARAEGDNVVSLRA